MRIKRILMVEDDREVAAKYRLRLEFDGFPVQIAHTGETALTLAMRSRWSLVLVDVGLAGMSGLDVLAALRSDVRTADVPVVMLSDRHDSDLLARAFGLGAIDYLITTHTTPARYHTAFLAGSPLIVLEPPDERSGTGHRDGSERAQGMRGEVVVDQGDTDGIEQLEPVDSPGHQSGRGRGRRRTCWDGPAAGQRRGLGQVDSTALCEVGPTRQM
jgi:CheY-like chemotaxis protein